MLFLGVGIVVLIGLVEMAVLYFDWESDKAWVASFPEYSQRVVERYCSEWGLSPEVRERRSCCLESIQNMTNYDGKILPFASDVTDRSGGCREGSSNLLSCRGAVEWCDSDEGRLPIITLKNVSIESGDPRIVERNKSIIEELAKGYSEPSDRIAIMIEKESERSVTVWALFRKNREHNGRFTFVYYDVEGQWHIGSEE